MSVNVLQMGFYAKCKYLFKYTTHLKPAQHLFKFQKYSMTIHNVVTYVASSFAMKMKVVEPIAKDLEFWKRKVEAPRLGTAQLEPSP